MSERSTAVAYDISEPLSRFLRLARDLSGGDLDKALVMVEIILRAHQHPGYRRVRPDQLEAGAEVAFPSLGANVRSLAEVTGIPRESVRRKVLELIAAGWVVRDGRKLRYSLEGYHAIAPAREAMYRMYARAYQVVGAMLDSLDEAPQPSRNAAGPPRTASSP